MGTWASWRLGLGGEPEAQAQRKHRGLLFPPPPAHGDPGCPEQAPPPPRPCPRPRPKGCLQQVPAETRPESRRESRRGLRSPGRGAWRGGFPSPGRTAKTPGSWRFDSAGGRRHWVPVPGLSVLRDDAPAPGAAGSAAAGDRSVSGLQHPSGKALLFHFGLLWSMREGVSAEKRKPS